MEQMFQITTSMTTESKAKVEYIKRFFVCFDSLRPINKFYSYKGTGLPELNEYYARINVSCSKTHGSDAVEARTRGPSVSSQAFYH